MSWGEPPPGEPELQPQDSPDHPLAPWFEHARERRREHYASRPRPQGPRRRAVITMVHNEPVFLPLWLRYYSRWFEPDDVYVLDNETDDGSTDRPGFVRIPVEHEHVDHTWMVRTIERLQHELLDGGYDMVLVTDVDEIVTPVPEWGTLGDYLDRFDEEWVNCLGYELLHMRDSEPPLDLARPILDQREHWFPNDGYSKAALATVPMTWRPGFHGRADYQFNMDPDLRLIHLHRMDYDICLARHRTRNRKPWADEDADRGWAVHNRIVDEAEFARWFYEDSSFEGLEIRTERMRPSWRGVF
jgi:hypothetical protein